MGAKEGRRVLVGAALVLLFALLAGCGGASDEGSDANSHINEGTGATNGISPDNRAGIPPPPVRVTNLEKAARDAGCFLFQNLDDEGHRPVPPEAHPEYATDPPSSGPHVEPPHQQADGAYLEMPSPVEYVASLDHGRLEIQYALDIPEKIQRELKGLFDTMYGGTLLFPNYEMNYGFAATAWTNVLDCPGWAGSKTLDAIRAFGKATWGKYGDEPVDKFPVEGPTPANPEEPGKAGSDSAP
jgi:hypothetical protein